MSETSKNKLHQYVTYLIALLIGYSTWTVQRMDAKLEVVNDLTVAHTEKIRHIEKDQERMNSELTDLMRPRQTFDSRQ